jgi:hypothetical protein
MLINTHVVRALMALRRIDEPTLANIANVATPLLSRWLADGAEGDELIAFDTQLEILRVLGINGETLRSDIVHYWYVHQELFSTNAKTYWAVQTMTEAFGQAEVVYFAKDTDPLASMTARTHFGLQFSSFKVVLEVSCHPLRNIGFDPADFEHLQWAANAAVLVDREQFEKLAPGLMTPLLFDSQMSIGREQLAWERLNLLSREHRIGPEQLELLLRNVQQGLLTPQLGGQPQAAPAVAPVAAPAVAPVAPADMAAPETAPAREPAVAPVAAPPAPAKPQVVELAPEPVAGNGTGVAFVPRPRRRTARPGQLRSVGGAGLR